MKIGIILRLESEVYKALIHAADGKTVEQWIKEKVYPATKPKPVPNPLGPNKTAKKPEAFLAWLEAIYHSTRSYDATYRIFLRHWFDKDAIPGYENFPDWPSLPPGCSKSTLSWHLFKTVEAALQKGK